MGNHAHPGFRAWWGLLASLGAISAATGARAGSPNGGADLRDVAAFQRCFSDAQGGLHSGCADRDIDGDLDVDLDDYRLLWCVLLERSDTSDRDGDGIGDCTDPCPRDPVRAVGPCTDILVRIVVVPDVSGLDRTEGVELPASDSTFIENSCFVAEIWVMDVSEPGSVPGGVACLYIDVAFGEMGCPVRTFNQRILLNPRFSEFRSGVVQNDPAPGTLTQFGGCTREGGIGVGRWELFAVLEMDGPDISCVTDLRLGAASGGAALFGVEGEASVDFGEPGGVDFFDRGELYDFDGDGRCGVGDFAVFVPCWLREEPLGTCASRDFDCDGIVGPSDLAFFSTCLEEERVVSDSHIVIPFCQFDCPGLEDGPEP